VLNLPEFSADRVVKRLIVWAAIICVGGAGFLAYWSYSGKIEPSKELKGGLKAMTDPESVVNDL
jgi:hypothetical protein